VDHLQSPVKLNFTFSSFIAHKGRVPHLFAVVGRNADLPKPTVPHYYCTRQQEVLQFFMPGYKCKLVLTLVTVGFHKAA
jgi:hypothetical protein